MEGAEPCSAAYTAIPSFRYTGIGRDQIDLNIWPLGVAFPPIQ